MATHVLRIEGVNFDATLFDTQDLSCCRGASLALLHAERFVRAALESRPGVGRVETIFAGASAMAFSFDAAGKDADDALEAARSTLADTGLDPDIVRQKPRENPPLAHLSFVIALERTDEPGGIDLALARAEARNRFDQFRAPTVVLPLWEDGTPDPATGEGPFIDPLNRVLPANTQVRVPDDWGGITLGADDEDEESGTKTALLSRSVAARRHYGRRMRQAFYAEELKGPGWEDVRRLNDDLRFTNSIAHLCEDPPDVPDGIRNKIAVLYFDGNAFGGIRREMSGGGAIPSAGAIATFSSELQTLRRSLLGTVLRTLTEFWTGSDDVKRRAWVRLKGARHDALRFETLLWGGDEVIWVAPAWLGFGLADKFFALTKDWSIGDHRLTHAGGMVVCDRKTPIRQAKALAHDLAERAKQAKGADGKPVNALQVEIVESADPPDGRLDEHRRALYPGLWRLSAQDLTAAFTLAGDGLTAFIDDVTSIRREEDLPRSKIHDLLQGTVYRKAFGDPESETAMEERLKDYLKAMGRDVTLVETLKTGWGVGQSTAPLSLRLALLAQCWDYVSPFAAQDGPPGRIGQPEVTP